MTTAAVDRASARPSSMPTIKRSEPGLDGRTRKVVGVGSIVATAASMEPNAPVAQRVAQRP
jgi:hypothetical protein